MPKKKPQSAHLKRSPRINLTVGHGMMEKLALVQQITGLPSIQETARYLMARGAEGLNAPIQTAAMIKKLEASYSPEEMLPLFEKLEHQKPKE